VPLTFFAHQAPVLPFARRCRGRPYRVLQYVGHIVGTVACVWLLRRSGRSRWMAGRAVVVPAFPATPTTRLALAAATATTALGGALWAVLGHDGIGPFVMRIAGGAFRGLALGSAWVRRMPDRPTAPEPATASSAAGRVPER
jgi:hypothetical protein